MAVNATFKADFSSFLKAIDQAEIALVDFGKGASTVEKQLNRMVDNFSGRKLIQEASLLTIAVEKAGGVAKLTAREFEMVGAKANEAAEKMHKLGYEVPAGLQNLADATKKAETATGGFATATGTLTDKTKAFDNVLQQTGVSIGPFTKAFDEIAATAGKSVGEIGKLSTAGLAMGAAYAGWQLGRMIADFFKLDEKIANATASLLGYGNVAAETAGAQEDTINAAIAKGYTGVRDYAEAIKYLTEWHKKRLATVKEANEADLKTKEAMVELNSVGASTQKTLEGLNGAVVEAVKYYLAAGVAQGSLATAYGLTAAQVKAIADSMKDADAADKAWLEGMKAAAAEADLYAEVLKKLATDGLDKTTAANERAVASLTRKTDAITASILAESAARESLTQSNQGYDAQTTAWMKMQKALADLDKQKVGDIDTTARQQVIWNDYTKAIEASTAAQQKAPAALEQTTAATEKATKAAGVYMNQLNMLVTDPKLAAFFGGNVVANTLYSGGHGGYTPEEAAAIGAGQFINKAINVGPAISMQRRASGGPVSAGSPYLVGEHGPELFVPGQSGSIAAGVTVSNVFHVNGTAQDVARQIADILNRSVMQGRKLSGS
jgi:hypothetical protein